LRDHRFSVGVFSPTLTLLLRAAAVSAALAALLKTLPPAGHLSGLNNAITRFVSPLLGIFTYSASVEPLNRPSLSRCPEKKCDPCGRFFPLPFLATQAQMAFWPGGL
jgi:hypothetical protein